MRRLQQRLVLDSPSAEFAFPVRRSFHPDHGRPQMCHIAKKLDRALFVAVFHFAIRRAHATQRLNAALDALDALGISYEEVTALLEKEGVEKFIASWNELLDTVTAALESANAEVAK